MSDSQLKILPEWTSALPDARGSIWETMDPVFVISLCPHIRLSTFLPVWAVWHFSWSMCLILLSVLFLSSTFQPLFSCWHLFIVSDSLCLIGTNWCCTNHAVTSNKFLIDDRKIPLPNCALWLIRLLIKWTVFLMNSQGCSFLSNTLKKYFSSCIFCSVLPERIWDIVIKVQIHNILCLFGHYEGSLIVGSYVCIFATHFLVHCVARASFYQLVLRCQFVFFSGSAVSLNFLHILSIVSCFSSIDERTIMTKLSSTCVWATVRITALARKSDMD